MENVHTFKSKWAGSCDRLLLLNIYKFWRFSFYLSTTKYNDSCMHMIVYYTFGFVFIYNVLFNGLYTIRFTVCTSPFCLDSKLILFSVFNFVFLNISVPFVIYRTIVCDCIENWYWYMDDWADKIVIGFAYWRIFNSINYSEIESLAHFSSIYSKVF